MRPIASFAHLMSSTITVEPRTGVDAQGRPTYGSSTTYAAHLMGEQKRMVDDKGQETVSRQQVIVSATAAVTPTSRVTLSTADVGSTEASLRQPLLLAVQRRFDQGGGHHLVLYFR